MADFRLITDRRRRELVLFSERINVPFEDFSLLNQALTHTSYANEGRRDTSFHNERLEFLGDAVLELVVSTYLYKSFPSLPEGELTKARASVVCEPSLAKCAATIGIGEYLRFGKGELTTGGRERASILADAFESVIGAVYLVHGIEYTGGYILRQLEKDLSALAAGQYIKDYKTALQELVQKKANHKIEYKLLLEDGPDHDKIFTSAVVINGESHGIGKGRSKKESEQRAAQETLKKLGAS